MSAPAASGGVKNLRAMFEVKEDVVSPLPNRGRSPANSIGGGSAGTSPAPRPLSKVRTAFVAVESKNGQMGLVRRPSEEGGEHVGGSMDAERRPGFSMDEKNNPAEAAERKKSLAAEFNARRASVLVEETIPESAVETPRSVGTPRPGMKERTSYMNGQGSPITAPPTSNSDNLTLAEEPSSKSVPGDPAASSTGNGGASSSSNGASGDNSNGRTDSKTKRPALSKGSQKQAASKVSGKAGPTTLKTLTKPVTKHSKPPTTHKEPTTPTSRSQPSRTSIAREQPKPLDTKSKVAPRPRGTSIGHPPKKTEASKESTIRSPTRPVNLPASLTAPTASLRAKLEASGPPTAASSAQRRSLAIPSNSNGPAGKPSTRPSLAPAATITRSKSTTANRSSAHDRPSLGRPSMGAGDHSLSKKEVKEADEGFLARMMRPTTASKSKVHDKIETTPPRKAIERKSTVAEPNAKADTKALGSPFVKKAPAARRAHKAEDETTSASKPTQEATKSPVIAEKESAKTPTTPAKTNCEAPTSEKPATRDRDVPAMSAVKTTPKKEAVSALQTKKLTPTNVGSPASEAVESTAKTTPKKKKAVSAKSIDIATPERNQTATDPSGKTTPKKEETTPAKPTSAATVGKDKFPIESTEETIVKDTSQASSTMNGTEKTGQSSPERTGKKSTPTKSEPVVAKVTSPTKATTPAKISTPFSSPYPAQKTKPTETSVAVSKEEPPTTTESTEFIEGNGVQDVERTHSPSTKPGMFDLQPEQAATQNSEAAALVPDGKSSAIVAETEDEMIAKMEAMNMANGSSGSFVEPSQPSQPTAPKPEEELDPMAKAAQGAVV